MADTIEEIPASLAASPDQHIYAPVELSHADRVKLALAHGVHSVWDNVRGMWAFSAGVPEEHLHGYLHETDAPEVTPAEWDTNVAPVPTPATPVPVAQAKAAAESGKAQADPDAPKAS